MADPIRLGDGELLARMPSLASAERSCTAEVIEHLVEIDRRRLYLDAACSSLSSYCMERLSYSEDEAAVRVRVTRVAARFPRVVEELRGSRIHMSGLGVLAAVLTAENCDFLLDEARDKTRRQIEELVARRFPRPSVPDRVAREPEQVTALALSEAASRAPTVSASTASSALAPSAPSPDEGASADVPSATRSGPGMNLASKPRVAPLGQSRWAVQFTADDSLHDKIQRAKELVSHSLPNGDLAALFERALDALIAQESKRRFGAGKPGKSRARTPHSRHVPVDVGRQVWERDGGQCTFVSMEGRRCSARRFLTYEHLQPFALEGPMTVENLCLRCKAHNLHAARRVFGEAMIDAKCVERGKEV